MLVLWFSWTVAVSGRTKPRTVTVRESVRPLSERPVMVAVPGVFWAVTRPVSRSTATISLSELLQVTVSSSAPSGVKVAIICPLASGSISVLPPWSWTVIPAASPEVTRILQVSPSKGSPVLSNSWTCTVAKSFSASVAAGWMPRILTVNLSWGVISSISLLSVTVQRTVIPSGMPSCWTLSNQIVAVKSRAGSPTSKTSAGAEMSMVYVPVSGVCPP